MRGAWIKAMAVAMGVAGAGCVLPANGYGNGGYGGYGYGGAPAAVVVTPAQVPVTAPGCRCAGNTTIVVMCSVSNHAPVNVAVSLSATAETGTFGVDSAGSSTRDVRVAAGSTEVVEVLTDFDAMFDCSSCKSASCSVDNIEAI
ncbi:MAG: hypothetical protein R2939_07900 [Kofleriaceae bacterium]